MGLKNVKYNYTGGVGGRGWKGDIKITHLAIDKLMATGWKREDIFPRIRIHFHYAHATNDIDEETMKK